MKFSELLLLAIRKSEIPPRFEPGAEEALAKPILDVLKAWIQLHEPEEVSGEFDRGQLRVLRQLAEELEDRADVPE